MGEMRSHSKPHILGGLEHICSGLSVHGRFDAPIPKHNCAMVGMLLGFHYGYAE
jgi:hypothetical protein